MERIFKKPLISSLDEGILFIDEHIAFPIYLH